MITAAPLSPALRTNMTIPEHYSPYIRGGDSPSAFYRSASPQKVSHEAYLPSPNSASPQQLMYQHQHPPHHPHNMHAHMQSQQTPPHQAYQHYSPSSHPPPLEWNGQPQAGPSTYRMRSPESLASPLSMASAGASRVQSEHGLRRWEADEGDGRAGVEDPFGERSYTELKCLGDGSFGTVWLCDWHSPVRSDVLLSAMQCGAGARPEWAGKRLVALKRMKRVWEGGWQQAKTLGELVSLRRIPPHAAVIPLYDAFISPKSRELYFVFECMEGNLYQLTKSRRGRPLAAGLIASCFHQISSGLYHIHQYGYFHRDMKPENLLVTTTGLTDYLTAASLNSINSARAAGKEDPLPRTPNGDGPRFEKDVAVIVKLADFGLARATSSKPPYTEYVSTRWYRAPEVLLRSTEYGPPVDMWALGTILAEMLNLKPLFPGVSEIDQVYRICDTLGDPSADYGVDERGRTRGGGSWNTGIKLAKNVGFSFPKREPVHFRGLFNEQVPQSLVDCIADLLRYNPRYRLTSAQCVDHTYFHETLPHLQRAASFPRIAFAQGQPPPGALRQATIELNAPARQVPPSHSHSQGDVRPAFANGDMRNLPPPIGTPDHIQNGRVYFPNSGGVREDKYGASALVNQLRELDLPTDDLASYGVRRASSPGAAQGQADPRRVAAPDPRVWAGDVRRPSAANSAMYDGSNFEGSAAESNQNLASYQSLSVSNLQIADPGTHRISANGAKAHLAAFVQQQQQNVGTYEDASGTPRAQDYAQMPSMMAPPIEPTKGAAKPPAPAPPSLAPSGKKKKWGLSSVFGSSEKHLPIVEETSYQSSSSLKRTQSGSHPESVASMPPSSIISDDPKKAKKDAERAAREYAKAKREANEQAMKERSRAVMRKREQLVEVRKASNNKSSELEFGGASFGLEGGKKGQGQGQAGLQMPIADAIRQHPELYASGSSIAGSTPQLGAYPNMPASQSVSSVRSHESLHSNRSHHSIAPTEHSLSANALAARDRIEEEAGLGPRHKARRRDEDDDHSMSSFDVNSLRSRSVLTVGTVDSDPGPRRPGQWPEDPRRQASMNTSKSRHSSSRQLMLGSNPSLDSQLAHDLAARANLASTSSTSLGRHGQSNLSLHDLPPPPPLPAMLDDSMVHGQGSAPTSPYGHPKGLAVAHGVGMGRPGGGQPLPSISDWQAQEDDGYAQGQINPMFRVPPAQHSGSGSGQGQTTMLPPFSAIASVADTHQRQQQQGQR